MVHALPLQQQPTPHSPPHLPSLPVLRLLHDSITTAATATTIPNYTATTGSPDEDVR